MALTDTDDDMGGFQCLPGLYRNLDEWLAKQPCGKAQNPNLSYAQGDYSATDLICPEMKAGDLLMWDSFLPHGNGPNRGKRSRYAQYVTMFPEGDDRLRAERFEGFVLRKPPSGWAFPGDPRGVEARQGITVLSDLGKKLLGQMRQVRQQGETAPASRPNPGNIQHNHSAGSWACPHPDCSEGD